MPISIACPHCDWKGRVKDELAGRKGKCPTCGELIPIPAKGSPPPVPGGQKPAVDAEPDVVDDADIVEDEPRAKSKPGRPAPSSKGRRGEDEDDRPRRRRDEDDEDDRPSKSRRRAADDEDEDDRPPKARRRRDEDDEDEDRPSKRRRAPDDDEDADRPPKRRRSGGKIRRRASGRDDSGPGWSMKRIGALISGVLAVLVGGALLAWFLMGDGRRLYGPIILIVLGLIGIFQGLTGAGLGED
jgi:hypothetical protein